MEILSQWSGGLIALVISIGFGLIGYGRLKGSMITRKECNEDQQGYQSHICNKLEELKVLSLSLHKENANRIDSTKDMINDEFRLIAKSIGRIEGQLGNS